MARRHPKAICLLVMAENGVQGFTWGYDIDSYELRFIAGHDYSDVFYGRKLFYLAELGVDKNFREQGIGKKLTATIINFAKISKCEMILLRTDKNALAAQAVYKKFGFVHFLIPDGHYPSRSYWALKLRQ